MGVKETDLGDLLDYYDDDEPYLVRRRSGPHTTSKNQKNVHYIDEDIENNFNTDELMHRLMQELHIHDEHSSERAIQYLE